MPNFETESGRVPLYDRFGSIIKETNEMQKPIASEVIHLGILRSNVELVTADLRTWHSFWFKEQERLKEGAPDLLNELQFDLHNPTMPWSPELSRIMFVMRQSNTITEWSSLSTGLYYEINQDIIQDMNEELSYKYQLYDTEIGSVARNVSQSLSSPFERA